MVEKNEKGEIMEPKREEPKRVFGPVSGPVSGPEEPKQVSGIQPIPLDVTARQSNAVMKAALDRLRKATDRTITSACELAREARSASSETAPPTEPAQPRDVTERFEAIRANVR